MLGYESVDEVQLDLYETDTREAGFFNWDEFLDFFLSHSSTLEEKKNPWWKKIINEEN
jgi:hypothetical protein